MTKFATFEPRPFFPTYVRVMDLKPEVHEPLNRQILKDLNELTAPRPERHPGQNWQTEQTLHEFDEFGELVDIFKSAAARVLDELEVEYGAFEITGCWANINPRGAFHMPHTHPNNYLSGVYYAQVQSGADAISFHDPRHQPEVVSPQVRRETIYTSTVQEQKLAPGRLVLFPSWLIHSVVANRSDRPRISISFNVMFSSFAETMSRPKWSGIPLRRK
ncbi:MAG: 2OG-Fe(II) oxygenase family protein [Planctomycetota bacterium]|jgi:uncharacterized protein (TIGR02466 family)